MRTTTSVLVAGLLVLAAFSGSVQAQTQAFLRIDGILGESIQSGHANEIDIESLALSVDQTGIRTAGGKGAPARSRFSVINVTKRIDRSSPELFLRSALGSNIPTATITVRRTGPEPQDFYTINLRDVIISSFSTVTSGDVFETVGLSYKVIEFTYRQQNQDGSLGPAITRSFNVNQNKVPATQ